MNKIQKKPLEFLSSLREWKLQLKVRTSTPLFRNSATAGQKS